MELRMQYAVAEDGVRIAFGTAGNGPWIIRVPSLPFSHCELEWSTGSRFFDELTANFSVAQYDPRGTGLSDRDVTDFSFEARLRDLQAVIDRLGVDTFALHGIGWGGPLAVAYTVRNPDRVSHLILDDTQARIEDFMNIPQIRALDQLTGEWDSFLEFLVFTIYGLGRDQAAPYIDFMRACVSQETAQRIFDAVRGDDVTDLLSDVKVPTLVMQHGGMARQALDAARDMTARIPDSRMVMLSGAALDDTDKIVRSLADLLGTQQRTAVQAPESLRFAPGAVRAILFTDIVEHTGMMRRLGDDAGRKVLREHEELTRDVLRQNGGEEVKSMGDGFMASFSSVSGAVECAIALQRSFQDRNTHTHHAGEPDHEPLQVRIGLNAGEPIQEGGDLFGATVIMASRIAAQAAAGEILASDVVRGLCSGKGFLFADRGETVLRGFEDPVRLYQIRWQD